jgi:glycosyltransferase involved in cell wall biosynthesis
VTSVTASSGSPARTGPPAVIPGVALICTLYNEAASIGEFLDSVRAMDALPEEFIIVDGGSTDGTNELIAAHFERNPSQMKVRHLVRPDCNRRATRGAIARGRNVAISEARCDIIAATDAGCLLEPDWLSRITAPLLGGGDVAGGWYLPEARTSLERCIGNVWVVPPGAVDPDSFLPSSRSIAFRKSAWSAVGGYPEWTYSAEDTIFNLGLRRHGFRIVYVPEAIVRWRMLSSVREFANLAYKYGFAEGLNRIMASSLLRAAVKVSLLALLLALSVFVHPAWFGALILSMAILAGRRHGGVALSGGFLAGLPCAIFIKAVADISYLTGHIRGRLAPAQRPPDGTGT